MPQAWQVGRELFAEGSFAGPGWCGNNEKNTSPVHRRPRVVGYRHRRAARGG